MFFKERSRGRKKIEVSVEDMNIELRKSYYSVEDIKVAMDSKGISYNTPRYLDHWLRSGIITFTSLNLNYNETNKNKAHARI